MRVPKRYEPDVMERQVIERWRKEGTFDAQVQAGRKRYREGGRKPEDRYIFLEGPPTANGLPHPGHVLTRTLKDSVCRFHAMQGQWVPRKAGWDCHGLPVEIEVQKELGIERVEEIDGKIGMPTFLEKCKESVFRYKGDWERMSERVGFWLDYDDPYVTMEDRYIESVWWTLKRLWEQGLLVKSYKVVPYSPVTKTSYSSHEVAQGYRDVVDTSVFIKFHLEDEDAKVLSWTTTPWTLPGNVALAVGRDVEYVKVRVTETSEGAHAEEGELLIVAKRLVKGALRNHVEVVEEMPGADLIGRRYKPLFPGAIDPENDVPQPWEVKPEATWTIVEADFVTTEDGTGVVHTAVMYGEDDFNLGRELGLPAKHTVGADGKFTDGEKQGLREVGLEGLYVKDDATEQKILDILRGNDMLYREEEYEHSYPHCWRTDTPLLYYAMESWYIQMSRLRDELLANNQQINWVPDSIKEGRMGDWLRNVKDWALSRNRFWGTPLPVWSCSTNDCHGAWCAGSREGLMQKMQADGLSKEEQDSVTELHRPQVDPIMLNCPDCGKMTLAREPYVIDVWYESGVAHIAQWSATSLSDEVKEHWPIDFIAEGLDQTRGWFYSLLASATALSQDPGLSGTIQGPTYRNCVVNGLILAEDGQKMSKSKKNYVTPDEVFQNQGADATRWYLLSATAPWQDKRFFEEAVRETFGKFFSTLWNVFQFHHQYAELDDWSPDQATDPSAWNELDRWLHSRLQSTIATATAEAQRYHLHKATRAIESFVASDLSNWWVRRSRDRFWAEADTEDKLNAHSALWEALHTTCRLVAPWAPFMVEHIWQAVKKDGDPDSVHLAPYPTSSKPDAELEASMQQVRDLAEAGRALRSKVGIPTRHPLGEAVIVGADLGDLGEILRDELNVKTLGERNETTAFKSFVARPDRAALGPTFKQQAPMAAAAIEALDGDKAHATLAAGEPVGISIEGHDHQLTKEHIQFEEEDRDGWATTSIDDVVLALNTQRDDALLAEAFTREVIRRLQDLRRQLDLDIEASVDVTLQIDDEAATKLQPFIETVKEEVRAKSLEIGEVKKATGAWTIEGTEVSCRMTTPEGVSMKAAEAA